MAKNKTAIFVIASALLFAACSTRPSYVISEKKMENIFYDLYLADVVKDDNYMIFANDSARRQELMNSVFDKYQVTEQEFDTSLLWYAGNLDRYERIVDKVIVRYSASADELKKEVEATAKELSENRNSLIDTAWFALRTPGFLQNRYVFDLKNPARLSKEKNFSVSFDVFGISSVKPQLYVHIFARDTIIKHHETIDMNGQFSSLLTVPQSASVSRVYGYIELPDTVPAFILFRNFSLSADSVQPARSAKPVSIDR